MTKADSGDSESPKKKRKASKEGSTKKNISKAEKLKISMESSNIPKSDQVDTNDKLDIETGLFDFDDVDLIEMERILGEMNSVSSPIDLLQQPPGSSTKMKLSGPRRGRPSTKSTASSFKESSPPDDLRISSSISEEELQNALQEMQSSDDFNLDDFLDDDAQLGLSLPEDLDFIDDEDFLETEDSEVRHQIYNNT